MGSSNPKSDLTSDISTPGTSASGATSGAQATTPPGFRDLYGHASRVQHNAIEILRGVFEGYGFEPLETSALEYQASLGSFLPDTHRPGGGVFSLAHGDSPRGDDDEALALRYDLTAPLARFYAQKNGQLTKPFSRYHIAPVWRNEKPGVGRLREFIQADGDILGASSLAADAQACLLLGDGLEALNINPNEYRIVLGHRNILEGLLDLLKISRKETTYLTIVRAIDKLDRLGTKGVEELLGEGRLDASGDYTKGAGLNPSERRTVLDLITWDPCDMESFFKRHNNALIEKGWQDLQNILALCSAKADAVHIDLSIVRGLTYYTGSVFEAQLHPNGKTSEKFSSIGGGGRYDDLLTRFGQESLPSVGCSLGVTRLLAYLQSLNRLSPPPLAPLVFLAVLDHESYPIAFEMAHTLRRLGINCEMNVSDKRLRAQLKYADKRHASVALIFGEEEREKKCVIVKDLRMKEHFSQENASREAWVLETQTQTQQSLALNDAVPFIQNLIASSHKTSSR